MLKTSKVDAVQCIAAGKACPCHRQEYIRTLRGSVHGSTGWLCPWMEESKSLRSYLLCHALVDPLVAAKLQYPNPPCLWNSPNCRFQTFARDEHSWTLKRMAPCRAGNNGKSGLWSRTRNKKKCKNITKQTGPKRCESMWMIDGDCECVCVNVYVNVYVNVCSAKTSCNEATSLCRPQAQATVGSGSSVTWAIQATATMVDTNGRHYIPTATIICGSSKHRKLAKACQNIFIISLREFYTCLPP